MNFIRYFEIFKILVIQRSLICGLPFTYKIHGKSLCNNIQIYCYKYGISLISLEEIVLGIYSFLFRLSRKYIFLYIVYQ
ncbi:hypothetical protein XELAEV_18047746mg [Xenopus laevis]|uniref:Uncharacterized protein n=1 Tax=Xenopus laevis TaxID=8355 RepID=A0A974BVX0_XENLA|nr:hypothetical protein XELAEV_18047746mg [Xenopus laevis]